MELRKVQSVEFCCPDCHGILQSDKGSDICSNCGEQFSCVDNIPVFVSKDAFYEGRFPFTIPCILNSRVLHPRTISEFIHNLKIRIKIKFTMEYKNFSFLHKVCNRLDSHSVVLDLGCGGGNELYPLMATVYGVDLSLSSLRNAGRIYSKVACADAAKLPFPKESFDLVISSDLWGHIPTDKKSAILKEIHRVLKFGGMTAHCIETDNNNQRFLKRKFPALYEKYFLEKDGHYGLEFPSQCVERFRKVGFKPLYEKPAFTFITTVDEYLKRFDNEIAQEIFLYRILVRIMRKINANPKVRWTTSVIFRLFDYVTDAILPVDNTMTGMIHVVYLKQ